MPMQPHLTSETRWEQKLSPLWRTGQSGALCSRTMPAKRRRLAPDVEVDDRDGGEWPAGNKCYNYGLDRNKCLGVCRSLLAVRSRCLSAVGNSYNGQAKRDISLYRITPGLWVWHCSFSVTMSPSRKEKQYALPLVFTLTTCAYCLFWALGIFEPSWK